MTSLRWAAVLLSWIGSASLATPVGAQTTEVEAANHFEVGSAAYKKGDFRAAAERFEQAHALAPRAATAYAAALAWGAAGEPARCADWLETALAQSDLQPTQRSDAQARLASLHRVLGVVVVSAPVGAAVTSAHVRVAPIPARFHAAPGPLDVEIVHEDASTSSRRVEVKAGETVQIAADARPPAAAPAAVATVTAAPPQAARPLPGPRDESNWAGGASAQTVLGIVALGAGAMAGGAAAILGVEAVSTRDEFADTGYTDRDLHDDTIALRTWTNVALGGAAALAIAGVVLLATSGGSAATASHRTLAPRASARGAWRLPPLAW